MGVKQEESYKKKRRNYGKAMYIEIKKIFDETDWTRMKELKDVQEKYDFFLMIYERAVKKFYQAEEKGKKRVV